MKKTRLGATILEGSDIADLPLVSENAQIFDDAILEVEGSVKNISAEDIKFPDGSTVSKKVTDIEKDINERWGKVSQDITGMDLDNITETGIYSGTKLINAPSEYYCYVEVIQLYTGKNVYQRLRNWSTEGRLYERNQVNGVWQEWKMVANEDDIKKTSDKIIGRVTAIERDTIDRWGKKSKKIDGMDLDTLIDSGIYVGTELINAPTNYYCYVEVIAFHSTSGAYQRVRSWGSSGRTYERTKVNSNWQEWKQVANQDDIKDISDHTENYDFHIRYAQSVAGVNAKSIPRFADNPIERLTEGMSIAFKNNAENTGAVTFNINDKANSGSRSVLKSNGQPLSTGFLKKDSIYTIRYNGVNFILQGEGGEYGTALTDDVIKGKTIGTEAGIKTGTLELSGDALPARVLKGNTFYSKDLKKKESGTMPNHGYLTKIITTQGGKVNFSQGYYTAGEITAQFPNLVASNIKEGVNVGGVIGNFTGNLAGPFEVFLGEIQNVGGSYTPETITVDGDISCVIGWSKDGGVKSYFGYSPFAGIGKAASPTPSNYLFDSITYITKRKVTITQYSALTLQYMIIYKKP